MSETENEYEDEGEEEEVDGLSSDVSKVLWFAGQLARRNDLI